MKKVLGALLLLVVLLLLAVLFGKNIFVKMGLEKGVKAATGFPLQVGVLDVGLRRISVRELLLMNPDEYEGEQPFINLPELTMDYDLASFFSDRVRLKEVRLDIESLMVVRNQKGRLNIEQISSVRKEPAGGQPPKPPDRPGGERPPAEAKPKEFLIERLVLKIGTVKYRDYSGGRVKPESRDIALNLDETIENVTSIQDIVRVAVERATVALLTSGLKQAAVRALEKEIGDKVDLEQLGLKGADGLSVSNLQEAVGKIGAEKLSEALGLGRRDEAPSPAVEGDAPPAGTNEPASVPAAALIEKVLGAKEAPTNATPDAPAAEEDPKADLKKAAGSALKGLLGK